MYPYQQQGGYPSQQPFDHPHPQPQIGIADFVLNTEYPSQSGNTSQTGNSLMQGPAHVNYISPRAQNVYESTIKPLTSFDPK